MCLCVYVGYVAPDILKAKVNESYSLNVDIFSVRKISEVKKRKENHIIIIIHIIV